MKFDSPVMYHEHSPTTFRFEPSISPPRFSTSFDYRCESLTFPIECRLSPLRDIGPPSPLSSRIHIVLSTPSPSAVANGNKVDKEIQRLRHLSEDWRKHREIEESESGIVSLGSRSPSPERSSRSSSPEKSTPVVPGSDLFQRRRSLRFAGERKTSLRSRSASPQNNPPCPVHSHIQNGRSSRRLKSRSPSPKPSDEKPPVKRNLFPSEKSYNTPGHSVGRRERSPSGSISSLTSFKGEEINYYIPRLRSVSPSPNLFRRSVSYNTDDRLLNSRTRSASPHKLNPASSDRNSRLESTSFSKYSHLLRSQSPLRSVSLLKDIFSRSQSYEDSNINKRKTYSSYDNLISSFEKRYSSLPRLRNRNITPVFNIFSETPENVESVSTVDFNSSKWREASRSLIDNYTGSRENYTGSRENYTGSRENYTGSREKLGKQYSSYSLPPIHPPDYVSERKKSHPFNQFSTNTMPSSHRRSSDEDPHYRRPLTTLREDDSPTHRRYYNERREGSLEPDCTDDDYLEQRRLSEAGVRKLSGDASVLLTEEVDTDSFIIGDRIWVGGTKPGSISYIGETQFAPGEWAGVTLDQYIGKNDGSVGGIRYFQCEPRKGVFSRLTRLTRDPLSDYELDILAKHSSVSRSESPRATSVSSNPSAARKMSPSATYTDQGRRISSTAPTDSLRKISSTPGARNGSTAVFRKSSSPSPVYSSEVKIGDSVVINSATGIKYGVLRFTGKTEFADGIWGGVELDEPTGKNDGSVAGKKYFTCRMKYGLFAPIGRISKSVGGSARRVSGTSGFARPSGIAIKRAGSKESVGASSVASSTVSMGLRKPSRPSTGLGPSTKALQDKDERTLDEEGFY